MNQRTSILTAVVTALLLALPVLAADKPGEGTKFFMDYRAAFQKAKAVEELFPFMSKEKISQVEKTPKADRVQMFELMKMMDMKNVKVTKETKTATGYTLDATGEGGMGGGPSKGTITIVREDGKLKLGEDGRTDARWVARPDHRLPAFLRAESVFVSPNALGTSRCAWGDDDKPKTCGRIIERNERKP